MRTHLLLVSCILTGAALTAQTWTETGEAGNLPATAQIPAGAGALAQIDGNIDDPSEPNGAGNDRDMYLIQIDNPAAFTATTVGGTALDTQLFLFGQGGLGVTFNDDTSTSTQSAITGQFVAAAGLYYLAVSRFDRDATGLGDEIWADTPFTTERQPDGPGAANAIDDWNGLGATGITGAYSIFLTGASFPDLSTSCADLDVSGTGAPGTDVVFSLTGAEPRAFAMLVVGDAEGEFSITIGVLGTLELGLAAPFVPVPMGFTDGNGDASHTLRIPPHWPHSLDLFAQGFSARLVVEPPSGPPSGPPVSLSFCTSDVEPFHVGK
jgi:hypothetical protein